jgi:flagellar assembly protein FliH
MSSFRTPGVARPAAGEAEPFVYPDVPGGAASPAAGDVNRARAGVDAANQQLWAKLQHRVRQSAGNHGEEESRNQLRALEARSREAEATLRADYEAALARERATVAKALEEFDRQKKSYFERVETEVVQLSLAIARKILHREAQADPLVLSGTIRVALEKVAGGSHVKLLVPEHDVFKWRQVIGTLKHVQPQPEVIGDASVPAGGCVLETDIGSSQISLEHQFREVERGLLDLLAVRTAS